MSYTPRQRGTLCGPADNGSREHRRFPESKERLSRARFVLLADQIFSITDFSRKIGADHGRAAGQDSGIPWAIRRDRQDCLLVSSNRRRGPAAANNRNGRKGGSR
jgi:hypothetical protein